LLPRLYAILDIDLIETRGLEPSRVLREWLDAGVRLIQLRAKRLSFGPFLALADEMADACQAAGATFIVNDRADVARLSRADGVHLGQDDLSPEQARSLLPNAPWIGVSTHTDAQLARAVATAATYVAIGPVHATTTKERPDPVIGLEGVRRLSSAARGSGRPIVAIGGITLATAAEVLAAGADSVAVISDLLPADVHDLRARAAEFLHAVT
jgi:thiamine-phosphate pyrophosphorylase